MRQAKKISGRMEERGVILTLVAVFMLFVVGAMAALSIDAVTLYTARSEAQLAADSAALAGARVLANSGMTSDPTAATDNLMTNAQILAKAAAIQVAEQNQVGGSYLTATNVVSPVFGGTNNNPTVTVKVQKNDLPTFFARIWGSKLLAVSASATAEAYNPSGLNTTPGVAPPVAPSCVKPWVLPNLSPTGAPSIIDRTTGAIVDTALLGKDLSTTALLQARCAPGTCGGTWWTAATPQPWQYYPGDPSSFPAPTTMLPACTAGFTALQNSIAGCVQPPIACGNLVDLEKVHGSLRSQTADAVNCLIHASASATTGDSVDPNFGPASGSPFEFLAGADNPLVQAGTIPVNTDVMVSDSIVTVPIYDDGALSSVPTPPVPIVGFVQVFLSATGAAVPTSGSNLGAMNAMVINIAGCGTGATGQAILGNGASPVAVRLITPP
jgi:putative Flp pilus-assembly TadE/G-like protein